MERTQDKSIQAYYLNVFNDILNDIESEFIIYKNNPPTQISNFHSPYEERLSFYPRELIEKERKDRLEQQLEYAKSVELARQGKIHDYEKEIGLLKQLTEAIRNYKWLYNTKSSFQYSTKIRIIQETMTLEQLKEKIRYSISKAKTEEAMNFIANWAHENNQEQLKNDVALLKHDLKTLDRDKIMGLKNNDEIGLIQRQLNNRALNLLNNIDKGDRKGQTLQNIFQQIFDKIDELKDFHINIDKGNIVEHNGELQNLLGRESSKTIAKKWIIGLQDYFVEKSKSEILNKLDSDKLHFQNAQYKNIGTFNRLIENSKVKDEIQKLEMEKENHLSFYHFFYKSINLIENCILNNNTHSVLETEDPKIDTALALEHGNLNSKGNELYSSDTIFEKLKGFDGITENDVYFFKWLLNTSDLYMFQSELRLKIIIGWIWDKKQYLSSENIRGYFLDCAYYFLNGCVERLIEFEPTLPFVLRDEWRKKGVEETNVNRNDTLPQTQTKKILFLGANPFDTGKLNLTAEYAGIAKQLEDKGAKERLVLKSEFCTDLEGFQEKTNTFRPNILHFAGHGSDANGELEAFGRGIGRPDWKENIGLIFHKSGYGGAMLINDATLDYNFQTFIEDDKIPIEVLVLNACYSTNQAEVLSKRVKYVVGVHNSIDDNASIDFSAGFYYGLSDGKTIESAFRYGKGRAMPKLKDKNQIVLFIEGVISNL